MSLVLGKKKIPGGSSFWFGQWAAGRLWLGYGASGQLERVLTQWLACAALKWSEGQLWPTLSFAPLHSHGSAVSAAAVAKMLTVTKGKVIWEVVAAATPLLLLTSSI